MKLKYLAILSILWNAADAQWDPSSSVNTSVCAVTKSQDNIHAVSDSNGGSIISWDDNRTSSTTSTDIYAHRVNKSGVLKWSLNGIAVCNFNATQKASAIADVGGGNAIIVWEDHRNGDADIYAQKIDSSGNILWAANGVPVCMKALHQKNPKVVSDNAGGAIIVWEDSLNNFWDVYVQRINSAGTQMWASGGLSVCVAGNTQINPKIETDGLGGAIIVWQDKRNNTDYDIYAQRVDVSGAIQWTVNGVAICTAVNTQSNPRIEPDGSNGAIIGWIDKRNAVDNNIFGQRVDQAGLVQWASNGEIVCIASGNQSALDIKLIGATGIIFTWKDARTATLSIAAQLMSLSGTAQLTAGGMLLSSGALRSNNPNVISDTQNGAIVAWQDSSSTGWDIKSQRLDANGSILWQNGGVTVSNASNDQVNVIQVADGTGGASFFWEDYRNTSDYNIYGHYLNNNGDVGIFEIRSDKQNKIACFPNPTTNFSVIKLVDNSSAATWQLQIFDQVGKIIVNTNLNANQDLQLDSINLKAGIYYYKATIDGTTANGSFIVTRTEN
jgi:hypothetical protein